MYLWRSDSSTILTNRGDLVERLEAFTSAFQRVAESTGKEVPADEIVKGYEVEKNQYVILSDDELRDVAAEKSTGIEIQEFVDEAEISIHDGHHNRSQSR